MRKWKPEETMLFVVPLAFVPVALLLTRWKQSAAPPAVPTVPTVQPVQIPTRGVPTPTPEPTRTEPPPTPRLTPEQIFIVGSRDGRALYTYGGLESHAGDIHAWDARTRVYRRSYDGLSEPYPNVELRLSPDGGTLYYQAWRRDQPNNRFGTLLDVRSGRQRQFTVRPGQDILHIGLGRHAFASVAGNSIELRSLRDGYVTGHIRAGSANHGPEMLCSSADGSMLAWIANYKGTDDYRRLNPTHSDALVVYSLRRGQTAFSRTLEGYNIREVAVSGDNTKVIALADYFPTTPMFSISNEDRKLLVFDLQSGRLRHSISLGMDRMGNGRGVDLQPSPDGKWLALQSGNYFHHCDVDWVQVVNLSSGHAQLFAQEHTSSDIAFGGDSREVFLMLSKHRFQLQLGARWREVPF